MEVRRRVFIFEGHIWRKPNTIIDNAAGRLLIMSLTGKNMG